MNRPASFAELVRSAREGVDFTIEVRSGRSGYAIVAPHGGRIEPGTDMIAKAIAGNDHSYYAFIGKRDQQNRKLHIASTLFDEPQAMALIQRAHTIITIHGCRSDSASIYVGGSDEHLKREILHAIQTVSLPALEAPCPGLKGVHPNNLCNRGLRGKGVQLELSQHIRHQLTAPGHRHPDGNPALGRFSRAVRSTISNHTY